MRKLREAFDAADVDGDNALELEELEMCIVSMNPNAEVDPRDIARVWCVLNPDRKDDIQVRSRSDWRACTHTNECIRY